MDAYSAVACSLYRTVNPLAAGITSLMHSGETVSVDLSLRHLKPQVFSFASMSFVYLILPSHCGKFGFYSPDTSGAVSLWCCLCPESGIDRPDICKLFHRRSLHTPEHPTRFDCKDRQSAGFQIGFSCFLAIADHCCHLLPQCYYSFNG